MRKNVFFNRDENLISGGSRYKRFFVIPSSGLGNIYSPVFSL